MQAEFFRTGGMLIALFMALSTSTCAFAETGAEVQSTDHRELAMQIKIEVEGDTFTATLEDSETARDFASLLPLSLTLEDYAATEKISDLPRRLSTQDAPAGVTPKTGDLAYYAPWGNLAIFHKDFRYSKGLIKLGTLDSGVDVLRRSGSLKATFSLLSAD